MDTCRKFVPHTMQPLIKMPNHRVGICLREGILFAGLCRRQLKILPMTLPINILIRHLASSALAQSSKPNFSGAWLLNKEKSDLASPSGDHRQSSGGRGSSGMGWPRMGGGIGMGVPGIGIGMGGPRMGGMGSGRRGGQGMGGPGTGGPDWGGSSNGSAGGGSHLMPVAEKLVIQHTDPFLTIERTFKEGGQEEVQDLKITTDGKANENKLSGGISCKSKTHWDGLELVTNSELQGSGEKVKITETRRLSFDGRTLTIEFTTKGGSHNGTQWLVYTKDASEASATEKSE